MLSENILGIVNKYLKQKTRPKRILTFLVFTMFLLTIPTLAEETNYVGSNKCKSCHPEEYNKIQSSIHQNMIRDASIPGNVHGNLSDPKAPKMSEITYVIGGWYKEESYIKKDGNNYNVTKYEWNPISQHYANDKSIRDWLVQCAGCHTTGYNTTTKTFKELNIGCEACHGPGNKHIVSKNKSDIVIDKSSEACGYCHIRAKQTGGGMFNFPVGYILGKPETLEYIPEPYENNQSFFLDKTTSRHREQYLDVKVSKHYVSGITCVSCHNSHEVGIITSYPVDGVPPEFVDRSIAIFDGGKIIGYLAWDGAGLKTSKENLCKSCHRSVSEYHSHNFSDSAKKAKIICTDCHMPDVINVNNKLRGAVTTHNFKSLTPENSIKYGADNMPNSCTYRCHQDVGVNKTTRANWAMSSLNKIVPTKTQEIQMSTTTQKATMPTITQKASTLGFVFAILALSIMATLARRR